MLILSKVNIESIARLYIMYIIGRKIIKVLEASVYAVSSVFCFYVNNYLLVCRVKTVTLFVCPLYIDIILHLNQNIIEKAKCCKTS